MRQAMAARRGGSKGGTAEGAAKALLEIVDSPTPSLRVIFGSMPYDIVLGICTRRIDTWRESEQLSRAADA